MNKLCIYALALAASIPAIAVADGSDDELLTRNRILSDMTFNKEKLAIQAEMAKSYKQMNDAGFIVDPKGVPLGIGDMERLALEVRRRGGMQEGKGYNPSDPFGGADPVVPVPMGSNMFGDTGFPPPAPMPAPVAPVAPPSTAKEPATKNEKVEVVEKPSDKEKAEGKQVLRLVEVRANSAIFFTNNGFKEVKVGKSIYDQKLTKLDVDSATLNGKDGSRIVRIDWTKSVRYSDD